MAWRGVAWRGMAWHGMARACHGTARVDFGLVHFALTNLGLFIVGAEAEALLGTVPFLCVYGLSASAGGIASMASDASKLTVTSSDGLMVSLF